MTNMNFFLLETIFIWSEMSKELLANMLLVDYDNNHIKRDRERERERLIGHQDHSQGFTFLITNVSNKIDPMKYR